MEKITIKELPGVITETLAVASDGKPIVVFGKDGIGKTGTVIRAIDLLSLRHNELRALVSERQDRITATDVVILRSIPMEMASVDIALAEAFQKVHNKPVIVTTSADAESIMGPFCERIIALECKLSFRDWADWAESSMKWSEGRQVHRIDTRLLSFLRENPQFFCIDRWHSPRAFEQVSRCWEHQSDRKRMLDDLFRETLGDDEMVKRMNLYLMKYE